MKPRLIFFLLLCGTSLLCALSTGGQVYLFFFLVMAVMGAFSLLSVLIGYFSLQIDLSLTQRKVDRGENITLEIGVAGRLPLLIAPLTLHILPPDAGLPLDVRVPVPLWRRVFCTQHFACPHVGRYTVGLAHVGVSDIFGLFFFKKRPGNPRLTLTVLPAVLSLRPMTFSPGDTGDDAIARARDDATSPADVRPWREGDPLKRIHWKLSLRRRELMVRSFEEPARPDALILMNCATPTENVELTHTLRDALCETAASLAAAQLSEGNPVRMPLIGDTIRDLSCDSLKGLDTLREALAQVPFDAEVSFEQMLLLETRRLRRTGGTAAITSRITGQIADLLIRIRRAGPFTRLYFISAQVLEPETENLLSRLEKHDIEVETVMLVDEHETPLQEVMAGQGYA